MTLAENLDVLLRYREALVVAFFVSLLATLAATPRVMAKLRGAGIVGEDKHKPGAPAIPEMGGLVVFVAFNMGVFFVLAFGIGLTLDLPLVMLSLVVIAGATMAGILDDLIRLRQRFKALISFAFAVPLALFVSDYTVVLPGFTWDAGLVYPLLLVPVGVASAANAFNMLEGFNGLGTGLGVIGAATVSFLALLSGNFLGLFITVPLAGALAGFWVYNSHPGRIFPGDTLTLMVGAALACAAILSKVEFWAGIMLLPHVVEFFVKAKARFDSQCFADRVAEDGGLYYEGPVQSLTHIVMKKRPGITEPRLVNGFLLVHAVLGAVTVAAYWFLRAPAA